MADAAMLDRTYNFILRFIVENGEAPHYTEMARELGISPAEGRELLHDLMGQGLPNWVFPGTDLIASFAPFNNLPTHYRVSVDGERKWFAQCGLEATAISWLFPGKTVEIDAPCLHSGEDMHIAMCDGVIEEATPDGIHFYVDRPIKKWYESLPFA